MAAKLTDIQFDSKAGTVYENPPSLRTKEEKLPLWKSILKNFFSAFAVFMIVIFCLFILEDSRLWKSASTSESGPYRMQIQRTDKETLKTEIRYLAPQEFYWLMFLEKTTMIGLPTMFIIGILMQWGLKIIIVPRDDDTPLRLE